AYVVSKLTLKVSVAFSVSFAGLVKSAAAAFFSSVFGSVLSWATLARPESRSAPATQIEMDDFIQQSWHERRAMSRENYGVFAPIISCNQSGESSSVEGELNHRVKTNNKRN